MAHNYVNPVVPTAPDQNIAFGVQADNITDAKVTYTTGDLDAEAEIIAAFNTTNGKINSIIAALEAFGISAP